MAGSPNDIGRSGAALAARSEAEDDGSTLMLLRS
jgi:hypothetical protein